MFHVPVAPRVFVRIVTLQVQQPCTAFSVDLLDKLVVPEPDKDIFLFANMFPCINLYNSKNVQCCVNFFMTSQWLPHAVVDLLNELVKK